MIRSKKEYRCTKCGYTAIKWAGFCGGCNEVDTLQEILLVPTRTKSKENAEQKRLRRRAKDSERGIARQMLEVDGPDPAFAKIASSTGRVGHITGMRIDAVSRSYVTENKNRKIPAWFLSAWILINQKGHDFNKNVLLHIEPPNMPKDIPVNGTTIPLDTMAVITQKRHEELIREEKILQGLEEALLSEDLDVIRRLYWDLRKI